MTRNKLPTLTSSLATYHLRRYVLNMGVLCDGSACGLCHDSIIASSFPLTLERLHKKRSMPTPVQSCWLRHLDNSLQHSYCTRSRVLIYMITLSLEICN
jgi:hypothetical protein